MTLASVECTECALALVARTRLRCGSILRLAHLTKGAHDGIGVDDDDGVGVGGKWCAVPGLSAAQQ